VKAIGILFIDKGHLIVEKYIIKLGIYIITRCIVCIIIRYVRI